MNVVVLMGRLVADPEMRQTQNGVSVTQFRIAVDREFSGKDGKRETDFFTCVAWRNTAEFIGKWFKKGRMIAVKGSLQSRDFTDKTGAKRTVYEVIVDGASFAGDKSEDGQGKFKAPAATQAQGFEEVEDADGDLPF